MESIVPEMPYLISQYLIAPSLPRRAAYPHRYYLSSCAGHPFSAKFQKRRENLAKFGKTTLSVFGLPPEKQKKVVGSMKLVTEPVPGDMEADPLHFVWLFGPAWRRTEGETQLDDGEVTRT